MDDDEEKWMTERADERTEEPTANNSFAVFAEHKSLKLS